MGAFKVGDRVRCVEGHRPANLHQDSNYTIAKFVCGYVYVEGIEGGWNPNRFTAATATPSVGINPKDLIGSSKPDYSKVPLAPLYELGKAMNDGARKYGPFNWREQPVNADVYINAARRHLDLWSAGEQSADDSGVHHLAHAMACMVILMDSQQHDSMNDNRVNDAALIRAIKGDSK